jgi:hypothetical protein
MSITEAEFDIFIKRWLKVGDLIKMIRDDEDGEKSWYYSIIDESFCLEDYDFFNKPKAIACVYYTYDLPDQCLPADIAVDKYTTWVILVKKTATNCLIVYPVDQKKLKRIGDETVHSKKIQTLKKPLD